MAGSFCDARPPTSGRRQGEAAGSSKWPRIRTLDPDAGSEIDGSSQTNSPGSGPYFPPRPYSFQRGKPASQGGSPKGSRQAVSAPISPPQIGGPHASSETSTAASSEI